MIDIVKIGLSGKSFGKDGQLKVYPDKVFYEDFANTQFLFFIIKGDKIPFRIIQKEDFDDYFIIKLKGIKSPEEATTFSNKDLFLFKDHVSGKKSTQDHKYIGYQVDLSDQENIGEIVRVEEHPQQTIAIIQMENQEIMIPIHSDLILSVNDNVKRIQFDYDKSILIM